MPLLFLKILLTVVFAAGAAGLGLVFGNLLFSGSLMYWSYFQILATVTGMAIALIGIFFILKGIWSV